MFSKAYDDKIGSLISTKDNEINREKNKSKPCNNNFKEITKEARKNAGVRYYFEKNASQIELCHLKSYIIHLINYFIKIEYIRHSNYFHFIYKL